MSRTGAVLVTSVLLASLGGALKSGAQIPSRCVEGSLSEFQTGCRELLFAAAEDQLSSAYKPAVEVMRRRDALAQGDKKNEARLTESQAAWVRFREAQCQLEGSIYAGVGGTGFGQLFYECRIRMTRERTTYLQKAPDTFGGN